MNRSVIILTGFMGTGKTAVGGRLARRLHCPFVDLDQEIEQQIGSSIAEIFAKHGEPHFRELEKVALTACIEQSPMVLSVGGGAMVDPDNVQLMKSKGWVIAFHASPEAIYQRLQKQPEGTASRPLLSEKDPLKTIKELMIERESAYAQAHWLLATEGLTVDEVVSQIEKQHHEKD
jgi:shikimate kinase